MKYGRGGRPAMPAWPAGQIFSFEGPWAPYGSGRGAPDGAPQKTNLAPHTIFYLLYVILNIRTRHRSRSQS